MLREVVRVTKRQVATSTSETVTLRREVVDVERVEGEAPSRARGFGGESGESQGEKAMKTVIGMFDQRGRTIRASRNSWPRATPGRRGHPDQRQSRRHTQAGEDAYLGTEAESGHLSGRCFSDGGTIVTANVGDTAVARAASILGSFESIDVGGQRRGWRRRRPQPPLADLRSNSGRGQNGGRRGAEADSCEGQRAATGARADRPRQERQRAQSDRGGFRGRQAGRGARPDAHLQRRHRTRGGARTCLSRTRQSVCSAAR